MRFFGKYFSRAAGAFLCMHTHAVRLIFGVLVCNSRFSPHHITPHHTQPDQTRPEPFPTKARKSTHARFYVRRFYFFESNPTQPMHTQPVDGFPFVLKYKLFFCPALMVCLFCRNRPNRQRSFYVVTSLTRFLCTHGASFVFCPWHLFSSMDAWLANICII